MKVCDRYVTLNAEPRTFQPKSLMSIITLLTDFGTRDEYVGLMKGVILSISPASTIVDITHQIDSRDTVQTAFAIHSVYRYFPAGSVHLIVVDPGVGTSRALLASEMKGHFFVAPDNGVLTLLFNEDNVTSLIRITNSKYFLASVSQTFHGRDIIAPVGAHITRGVALTKLGSAMDPADAVWLDNLQPQTLDSGEIVGRIVAADHFGNLVSNIDVQTLTAARRFGQDSRILIKIGSHVICGMTETYGSGRSNTPLALIGSRGYLEIAIKNGNAAQVLDARKGDAVRVII